MSELADHLRRRIALEGPLTVAEYMRECLVNPRHGYYMSGDPFGRGGDFTTAPEISQMFGELTGLWCAVVWRQMGSPAVFRLVELGPGRGTMMADALRAAAAVAGFIEAADLHLVELSPALRQAQSAALQSHAPDWHDDLNGVPEGPAILIANEFFDALPIHQFERTGDGWNERRIGLDDDGAFRFVAVPGPTWEAASAVARPGEIVEVCPAAAGVVRAIAGRLAADGGAALIIDYGYAAGQAGDTLQAVRDHAFHDILSRPGEADLTAHVDFAALAEAAAGQGAAVYGPVGQGEFLEGLGISARAETLLKAARPEQAEAIRSSHHRLVNAEAMGRLFKVLAIAHPSLGPLSGFPNPWGGPIITP